MRGSELTILSVSFRSESLLERNLRLTAELNPRTPHDWIIVNNEAAPLPKLEAAARDTGIPLRLIDGPPPIRTQHDAGSYHHATALMAGLKEVTGRFLLILDPDCFVLKTDWIPCALQRMKQESLSFLGSPWDPVNISKHQGFPSVHFLLIDLEKVPRALLDFTPDLPETADTRKRIDWLKDKFLGTSLFPWAEIVRIGLGFRSSRDTGFRMFERFKDSEEHRIELLKMALPKEKMRRLEDIANRVPRPLKRPAHYLLKKTLSHGKATPESQLKLTLKLLGSRDLRFEWDEFLWEGKPFAVHLRRVLLSHRSAAHFQYDNEAKASLFLDTLIRHRRAPEASA